MENNDKKSGRMALSRRRLWMLLAGFLVMVAGFILLMGGGIKDPEVFNEAMFDFRRLVAAPIVIFCGVAVSVVSIMKRPSGDDRENP